MSEAIAAKVRDVAEHDDIELTSGTLDFIEMHTNHILQPTPATVIYATRRSTARRTLHHHARNCSNIRPRVGVVGTRRGERWGGASLSQ